MAMKEYGNPDPGQHDDNPTLGCSSSLEYYKKALSYFIPYRLASWNPMTNSGNPTRSQPIIEGNISSATTRGRRVCFDIEFITKIP